MSYWPGELVQTLSINGNVLSINPGNSVTLPGGGGSQDWSQFPALQDVNMANNGLTDLNFIDSQANFVIQSVGDITISSGTGIVNIPGNLVISSINGVTPGGEVSSFTTLNASTINASSITANTFVALSTIEVTNFVSSAVVSAQSLINVSSINGSIYPAPIVEPSTISVSSLSVPYGTGLVTINQQNFGGGGGISLASSTNQETKMVFSKTDADQGFMVVGMPNQQGTGNVAFSSGSTQKGQMTFFSTLSGFGLGDAGGIGFESETGGFNTFITDSGLVTNNISTAAILVSSINGLEFSGSGGGSIVISTLATQGFSTIAASIQQGLMSSLVFNPQINNSFSVDMGMGSFLTTLGTGLFAVAVGVPVTAGTITYGMIKGLASVFEPRPINNITNNQFETFNYASQLQVSTLNEQVSTIIRLVSTIPSTIVINDQPTFSTISTCDVEYFVSTISPLPPFTAIRALGDPTQTVSTPWNVSQATPDYSWVPLPSGGGVSTFNEIVLAPSTLLKGDLDGAILEVIETANPTDYGEVKAAGYWSQLNTTDPNFGIYTRNADNIPTWIDSNLVPNPFALQNKQVAFSEVDFPVKDGNLSTVSNLFINNAAEPSITYALYPPGFPSTTSAQILFRSSINGFGGVEIYSQFGSAKSLAVTGGGVFASDIVTGSNSDYPLLVQVPDLDQWVLLGISTMSGGVGKSEIINTQTTNTGQLIIAAPNLSTGFTTRMMYLDSASTFVGINQPTPQATLDVMGDIKASGSITAGTISTSQIVTSSITAGTISTSQIVTSSISGSFTGSLSGDVVTASTVNAQVFNLTTPSFVAPVALINTTNGGKLVEVYENLGTPAGFITTITGIDATVGLQGRANIQLVNSISSVGICKTPDTGVTLDVEGKGRAKVWEASTVQTNEVVAPSTFINIQSGTGVVSLTPAPGWWAEVNSGVVAGDQQGLIKFGQSEIGITGYSGLENYIANQLYPASYDGTSWTNYIGRAVRVEYPILLDSSFPSGNGQAQFVLPVGLSTLTSFQATYVGFQDTNPAFNHPAWLYSTINDGNGLISTIQVGGEAATTVFVSVVGYV